VIYSSKIYRFDKHCPLIHTITKINLKRSKFNFIHTMMLSNIYYYTFWSVWHQQVVYWN